MTSAYPLPVAELADRVRDQATRLQGWPSLRQVMAEHRVGRPKAAAAIDALRTAGFTPTPTTTEGTRDTATDVSATALHLVPAAPDDDAPGDATDIVDSVESIDERTGTSEDDTSGSVVDDVEDDEPAVLGSLDTADEPASSTVAADEASAPLSMVTDAPGQRSRFGVWPLVLIALGAFVSIWGGWVGLGELTGFGPIRLLPGIADQVVVNSAITLPIGVEAYAAFALRVWLAPPAGLTGQARRFARRSAVGALVLGAAGQIAYHLMTAAGITHAPWPITAFVSCLPVVVLGCGAALTHLIHHASATVGKESHR